MCLSRFTLPQSKTEPKPVLFLSELITLAPLPSTSEVHTRLGNIELSYRYGAPALLRQHQGKLFVSTLAKGWDESRVQIHTGMSMMGLLTLVASCFEDLAVDWERISWWVVPIHQSCIDSPCTVFQSPHLLVIMGEDYWHFRLRPHGIIEILSGEGSTQFVTTLPKNVNRDIVPGTTCHSVATSFCSIIRIGSGWSSATN